MLNLEFTCWCVTYFHGYTNDALIEVKATELHVYMIQLISVIINKISIIKGINKRKQDIIKVK